MQWAARCDKCGTIVRGELDIIITAMIAHEEALLTTERPQPKPCEALRQTHPTPNYVSPVFNNGARSEHQ